MAYYLSPRACLKRLESPTVYHIPSDELYELDDQSFGFLTACSTPAGAASIEQEFISYCLGEDILVDTFSQVRRPPLEQSPVPSLRYLELQITDRCNLRCRHCYINSPSGCELSPEQVGVILSEFEEMQGLRLLITGGEPLLHPHFHRINELLPRFMFRKVLFSNGMLITKALLNGLHVDEIQLSIDGIGSSHDRLRGRGSYRRVLESLHLCLEKGIEVSVSTMVHTDNLSDFEEMDGMFRSLGIKDWTVDVPCAAGRLGEEPSVLVTPATGGKYLGYGFGGGLHGGEEGFGCGLHLMSVLADGRIAKCTFYADSSIGTVSDGLRACWSRIAPVRLADLACDCAYLDACRGGCRFRAESLEGQGGKDLYRCSLHGIIG